MATMQERINKQGQAYIAGLAATAKSLWALACNEDGIPVDSKFAVFSDGNRAAKLHDRAMQQYFEARQQYADGGYVGLRIEQGRAK